MRTKGKVWWEVARGEESGCGGDDDGVVLCLGLGQACLALVLLVEALGCGKRRCYPSWDSLHSQYQRPAENSTSVFRYRVHEMTRLQSFFWKYSVPSSTLGRFHSGPCWALLGGLGGTLNN